MNVSRILRIGLAFALLYPAVDSLFHPNSWIGFFPAWVVLTSPIDIVSLAMLFSVFEIALAVWLLFAKDPFYPAFLSFITLVAIVILDYNAFNILFRDVSIAFIALSLMVLRK